MAFTFLAAEGYEVGKSLLEAGSDQGRTRIPQRRRLLAASRSCCPPTLWWRQRPSPTLEPTVVAANAIPPDQLGLDIGPDSARVFAHVIGSAKTVFWNGPMGVAEWQSFAAGTKAVAQALTEMDGLSVSRRRRLRRRGS